LVSSLGRPVWTILLCLATEMVGRRF
jgi:hypothetical protein